MALLAQTKDLGLVKNSPDRLTASQNEIIGSGSQRTGAASPTETASNTNRGARIFWTRHERSSYRACIYKEGRKEAAFPGGSKVLNLTAVFLMCYNSFTGRRPSPSRGSDATVSWEKPASRPELHCRCPLKHRLYVWQAA